MQFHARQTRAQGFVAPRPFGQAFEQRAQVETGAADDDRQRAARSDFPERAPGPHGVIPGRRHFLRVENIKEMVGHQPALSRRRFRGAEVKPAVKLQGIAIDDLPVQAQGQFECQCALARSGGTGHDDERRVCLSGQRHALMPVYVCPSILKGCDLHEGPEADAPGAPFGCDCGGVPNEMKLRPYETHRL